MNDQRKTKKQLIEEMEQQRERSSALAEVSKRVAGAHDTDEVLDLIVNEAARLVGATAAFIRMLDGDHLVPSAATKSATAYLGAIRPAIAIGEGVKSAVGQAIVTKKAVITEDMGTEELLQIGRASCRERG